MGSAARSDERPSSVAAIASAARSSPSRTGSGVDGPSGSGVSPISRAAYARNASVGLATWIATRPAGPAARWTSPQGAGRTV